MARAKETTAPGAERYSVSFMRQTIADAIGDSNRDFNNCYKKPRMACMKKVDKKPKRTPADPEHLNKLQELIDAAGGTPELFAEKYSVKAEDPINPVYVRQIFNGHASFGDKARKKMAEKAGLPPDFFEKKIYIEGSIAAKLPPPLMTFMDQNPWGKLSPDEIELVSGYREAHPDVRITMLDMARRALKTEKTGTQ